MTAPPDPLSPSARAALQEWVRLFNSGQYFEAHEVLEGPWLASAEPEKTFLKGLIHAAAAMVHYQRGNAHGTRVKARSAAGYLERYGPGYAGLDVEGLLSQIHRFSDNNIEGAPPLQAVLDFDERGD